jgi:hypothetical protein
MKKFLILSALFILSVSCTDIVKSKLAGKWQLKTVEKNGVITVVDTVWYNFQSESLFLIQIYQPQTNNYAESFGFRTEKDGILKIEIRPEDTVELTDWTDRTRTFAIDKCKGKTLILRSEEGYIYLFNKF